MNHAGEITPLVAMVRPHVAIVTNVSPVHLEFFPSVEAIADAKAEIFLGAGAGRRGDRQPGQPALRAARRRCSTLSRRARLDLRGARARRRPAAGAHRRAEPLDRQGAHRGPRDQLPPGRARPSPRRERAGGSARRPRGRRRSRRRRHIAGVLPGRQGSRRTHPYRDGGRPVHADRRELQRQPRLDAGCAAARRHAAAAARRPSHRRPRRHARVGRDLARPARPRWRTISSRRASTTFSSLVR